MPEGGQNGVDGSGRNKDHRNAFIRKSPDGLNRFVADGVITPQQRPIHIEEYSFVHYIHLGPQDRVQSTPGYKFSFYPVFSPPTSRPAYTTKRREASRRRRGTGPGKRPCSPIRKSFRRFSRE